MLHDKKTQVNIHRRLRVTQHKRKMKEDNAVWQRPERDKQTEG